MNILLMQIRETISRLFLFIVVFLSISILFAQKQSSGSANSTIQIIGNDGKVRILGPDDDDDGDGIINRLEVNGFTYSVLDGLLEWTVIPLLSILLQIR